MKCLPHQAEALGVCAYCGRAVCVQCLPAPPRRRLACSVECAAASERSEGALEMILQKSLQSVRASAFYCYLCGALSAGASVAAYYMLPSPFLIYFTAGCAVALIASGIWYSSIARKTKL
ncbi:MAG TPA: hypothetical protein VFC44_16110 [Candidatus Saccharimonadales bacterium]|nr:hypothetical protein [Candidatus Saccharimonadales bacterium]